MTIFTTAITALVLGIPALADDASARAALIGSWQQEDSGTSVWVFQAKGDSLHITHSQGDQKTSDIECKPSGAECEGTSLGKKVKISMYFNGPTLVQFETAGTDVTKRHFTVIEKPEMLELEVMPIIGSAKLEKLRFKRLPSPN